MYSALWKALPSLHGFKVIEALALFLVFAYCLFEWGFPIR